MKFVKGTPKPPNSGRKKGTENRATIKTARQAIGEWGRSPITELIALLPFLEPKDQSKVLIELQSWVETKPKEIDVTIQAESREELVAQFDKIDQNSIDRLLKLKHEAS